MQKITRYLLIISIVVTSFSCAMQPRSRITNKKKRITVDEYIQKKITEGLDQFKNKTIYEEPPKPKVAFDGDIILKVPKTIRVYGKPVERKYKTSGGAFSEILPGGWRLLVENNQKGWIVHSLGKKEYPTIGDMDILTGRKTKK